MKLHLGCGNRDFGPEWVNIDKDAAHPHVVYNNVTKLLQPDDSCSLVYASHLLEYFDREEAIDVLKEWRRVLEPEGVLRLAVPDFEIMSRLYSKGHSLNTFLGPMYGKMGSFPIYHKTVYDFMSLKSILYAIGFKNVVRYDWKDTEHAHFDDHSQAYIPHMDKEDGTLISLNVEAVK
jgi:predicted SAM-dependent methyltransferase